MTLFERIRRFDAYAKTADDFRTQTFTGGVVTLVSVVLVVLLSMAAVSDYRLVRWQSEVKIDQQRGGLDKIKVSFDIVFPRVPCYALTLDVMDGQQQQDNVIENIVKTRLSSSGRELGKYDEVVVKHDDLSYCGSCYSLADLHDPMHEEVRKEDAKNKEKGICCNRCSSVFSAYAARRQPSPDLKDVEQCVREGWVDKIAKQSGEGCRARGHFLVDHNSGDFHFAPGESYEAVLGGKQVHVHDLQLFKNTAFDFSHHINSLRFGDKVAVKDDLQHDLAEPLRGAHFDDTDRKLQYSYFVKVVPTEFRFLENDKPVRTYQYSATRHKKILGGEDGSFPSLVVRFDISPMLVVNSQYRRPWTSLVTTLTAILGGIYTLAAIFDAVFYYAERRLLQKRGMGKAN